MKGIQKQENSRSALLGNSEKCPIVTHAHVIEPQYPAAVDRYVNLGEYYDITAAKAEAEEVKAKTHAYKAAYVRAYHCLKAARQVELDAIAEASKTFDAERLDHRISGIIARELRARGNECPPFSWQYHP